MRSRFKSLARVMCGKCGISFEPWQCDIIYDRVDVGGWPTRDRASPEEEC